MKTTRDLLDGFHQRDLVRDRIEAERVLLEVLHEVGVGDIDGARSVADFCSSHAEVTLFRADNEGRELVTGGIDRGGIPGAAKTNDEDVVHRGWKCYGFQYRFPLRRAL